MSLSRYFLYLIPAIISGICIWLPIQGAAGFFTEFGEPYVSKTHLPMLTNQLPSPILMLLCVTGLSFVPVRSGKWLTAAIILIMVTASLTAGCGLRYSHDFGHVILKACSNQYGIIYSTFTFCVFSMILAAVMIDFHRFRAMKSP